MGNAKTFVLIVNAIILQTWEYVWNNSDMEPPPIHVSDNEDGRINFSYPRSCFYTVDNDGVAICEEFPNEILDLNSIETVYSLCVTIFNDVTGGTKEDLVFEMTNKAIDKVFSESSGD